LNARYEKVRYGGSVVDCAVLIAVGIFEDGSRAVLGISVALSEAEGHWREFLESLCQRGLHGVQAITTDAHSGIRAALRAVFPSVTWQRCQLHLQQNAQAYVPQIGYRKEVASDLRAIFNAPSHDESMRMMNMAVDK
jgi:transposase-like protein